VSDDEEELVDDDDHGSDVDGEEGVKVVTMWVSCCQDVGRCTIEFDVSIIIIKSLLKWFTSMNTTILFIRIVVVLFVVLFI
jgi:hypothetical protein